MNKQGIIHILRILKKEKLYTFFNVTGLGLGMACTILVVLFASTILSYEKHFKNLDRLYLYGVNMTIGGISSTQGGCNPSVGPLFKDYMPGGIEEYVRINYSWQVEIEIDEKPFIAQDLIWADESIYDVFPHEFIQGSANSARKSRGIVLSKSMAEKYFPDGNAMGELIKLKGYATFEVTGIVKDPTQTSHITYSAILPLSSYLTLASLDYAPSADRLGGDMGLRTYFLFKEGFSEEEFHDQFKVFYEEQIKESDGINYKAVVDPVGEIYLDGEIWSRWSKRNKLIFYGFISVAIFMLVLASINYINLSTARAEGRAREVGVKKVLGSGRKLLVIQFLMEAFSFSLLSLFVGLIVAQLILEYTPFNELIGQNLQLSQLLSFSLGSLLIGITLLIGFLSGIYPAFFLSGIQPIKAIGGRFNTKYSKFSFRNVLVTIQLIVSISAIVLSMLMNTQLKFMLNNDLGFDKENVVVIKFENESAKKKGNAFKNLLLSNPSISSASFSNYTPGYPTSGMAYQWEQEDGTMDALPAVPFRVDLDYFQTLELQIVQGNGFNKKRMPNDSLIDIIVNEQFVRKIGWSEPIGKSSSFGRVIGVVKDFNFSSMQSEIRPAFITQYNPEMIPDFLNLKLSGQSVAATLTSIKSSWEQEFSNELLDLEFMDQQLQSMYEDNQNQITLNNSFSLISIIISCIGLIGLTAYLTAKRVKEIALRKVFGAGSSQLFIKLFAGIFYKILLASFIASYLGFLAYNNWVDNFVYQSPINYLVFFKSLVAVLIGSGIISFYYMFKVIQGNPADTLKYE